MKKSNAKLKGRCCSNDSPNLVVVAGAALPDLNTIAVGRDAIGEIKAFILVQPNNLVLRICAPLLIRVVCAASPDLHLCSTGVNSICNIKTFVREDTESISALCPRLSCRAIAILDCNFSAISVGYCVQALGRAGVRVNDMAGT